ncbi:MAG: hypothetical protein AAGM67_22180, partial [Bacteroidota bacterium]
KVIYLSSIPLYLYTSIPLYLPVPVSLLAAQVSDVFLSIRRLRRALLFFRKKGGKKIAQF